MKRIFIYGEREKLANYAEALEACGALPVFSLDLNDSEDCDALLLAGGGDIAPSRYGQELNGSHSIEPLRDECEIELVERFTLAGKPIFGICRGIQMINVALGGDLIQHLPTSPTHAWEEETGDKVHEVTVEKQSFLYELYGERFFVNSAHHQAVKTAGAGLSLSAFAPDGTVEALEDPDRKIYGVQWHPERMAFSRRREDTVDGRKIFDFFLGLL